MLLADGMTYVPLSTAVAQFATDHDAFLRVGGRGADGQSHPLFVNWAGY